GDGGTGIARGFTAAGAAFGTGVFGALALDEDPLLPLTARITTAATNTTIPTTMPTFAQFCWLWRASVTATARSRVNSTASVAPAASEGISHSASAAPSAERVRASVLAASSGGTCSELS